MAIERVAVLGGTGEEGFGLASRWARAGIEIVIGSRVAERAEQAAERLRSLIGDGRVSGAENGDAAAACDVVVVTVPLTGQAALYRSITERLREGAVVVDCTVPVAASIGGRITRVVGLWEGSAAQFAASLLPKGTTLCAAFHSLSAHALSESDSVLEGDVLACGATAGKPVVAELTAAIPNLRFVDAGPLENARIVEPITSLLVGLNRRYGTDRAGIRITGLPQGP